jgi:hypothetical protein
MFVDRCERGDTSRPKHLNNPYDAKSMRDAPAKPPASAPTRTRRTTQPFAWQGWQLRVPTSWNPVKLEGDFAKGYALLADLDGPRLGLRWTAIKAKSVTEDTLRRVIRDEAGDEAADRAKRPPDPDTPDDAWDQLVHLDRNPPGRDVFVTWMAASERLLEVVYHARRRDNVLVQEIIPSLADCSRLSRVPWAVFDLSCEVPAELALESHRLNAGDLTLKFGDARAFVNVRQLALAKLALRQKPLTAWLAEHQRARRLRYRAVAQPEELVLDANDGRKLTGLVGRLRRRRRFWWSWGWSREVVTFALHDEDRDRLVIVEASDEPLVRDVARTVGSDLSS